MITFKDSPVTALVEAALMHQALDEFASAVIAGLASSEGFSVEQKLGIQLVTESLVRSGKAPEQILDHVISGDFNGAVAVSALTLAQREGIILAIVAQAKAVLNTKAAELTALAAADYTIPTDEDPNV